MLDNYTYLKSVFNSVNIDVSLINIKNIINECVVESKQIVDKYYYSKNSIRSDDSTYHLSYLFIINDMLYQIVILDFHKESSWTVFDDWFEFDNSDNFFKGDVLYYIRNSKNYTIFNIPIKWFLEEDNIEHMCDKEMWKINPLIRKYKINKLLKR